MPNLTPGLANKVAVITGGIYMAGDGLVMDWGW
jgi:hypothetical protein